MPLPSFSVDEISARAMDETLAEVPSSAVAVFLIDERDGALRLRARRGGSQETFASVASQVRGSLAQPTIMFRPGDDIAFFAVPLRARNRFCGLVAVVVEGEPRLTATQRKRLAAVGDRAGELIEAAQATAHLERRRDQLDTLYRAGILLTSGLDLTSVLQRVADIASDLLAARYAALGVADDRGVIQEFYTSGITAEERARIGPLPRGEGLLGAIISERRTIRLSDLASDPRSAGFPPNHPPMRTFIGMPIMLGDRVLGNLYVTEKREGEFTREDEDLLALLAAQAAVAIENARLYAQVQRLAVLEERERIAMDLHDNTIQSIYAVGLGLEELLHSLGDGDLEGSRASVNTALDRLNAVIREIRTYIHELRVAADDTLGARMERVIHDVESSEGPAIRFSIHSAVADRLSRPRGEALLHILREALSNARRHAEATNVDVLLAEERGCAILVVHDDGSGFDPDAAAAGLGLRNMRERAASTAAVLVIESDGQGTTVRLEMPLG